jgi:2-keto-4-pentenoate hydratase/2-oxohepta-3-ene-1,7-dioic acid hydratase in catechol pathway
MKIFCVGRNYSEHAKELNNAVPTEPVIFMKPSTAVLKSGDTFYYPDFSKSIHYECELVLKISKNGKHIDEKFAHKYFDEITVGIDFTARDLQSKLKEKGLPWELAKAFDGSAVVGDFVTLDTLASQDEILFSLNKNNIVVQQGNSRDMIFSFSKIISFVSSYFTLQKGDLIYTGTPQGVGEVAKGDTLEGFLFGKKLMACGIR